MHIALQAFSSKCDHPLCSLLHGYTPSCPSKYLPCTGILPFLVSLCVEISTLQLEDLTLRAKTIQQVAGTLLYCCAVIPLFTSCTVNGSMSELDDLIGALDREAKSSVRLQDSLSGNRASMSTTKQPDTYMIYIYIYIYISSSSSSS